MDVTVTLEARYQIAADGSVWSQAGMARSFWQRYLDVFDRVHVVARASRVKRPPESWQPVTGDGIVFHAIPDFLGPAEYLKRYREVRRAIHDAVPREGAVIMRVGSHIANILEARLRRQGYPYALEVIGDPQDVFAPGVVDHPLRWFFRWHFSRALREQCKRAIGVAYVTRQALQRRYPTARISESLSDVELSGDALLGCAASTHFSSIELDAASISQSARAIRPSGPYRIVTVGSLAQLYKGLDVLIDAVARCAKRGVVVEAAVVGDGKYRPELERLATQLGVEKQVSFLGQLTAGKPVRDELDRSDLFVLPSRTEGLPRALIEAMARGLPAVASAVGGIPELLAEEDLVEAGNAEQLAAKICEVIGSTDRMERMSQRNHAVSLEYQDHLLRERRKDFYRQVRETTQGWRHRDSR